MDRQYDVGRAESRGTILVASRNNLFTDIVGGMVVASGFTPAYPAGLEPAWLSVTRTQPRIVICDGDASVESIKRLLIEVNARRLPLVMSNLRGGNGPHTRTLKMPAGVAWLSFPITADAFRSMLDDLVPTAITSGSIHRVEAKMAGVKVDAAFRVRNLAIVPRSVMASRAEPRARVGRGDAAENERADDDGMAVVPTLTRDGI